MSVVFARQSVLIGSYRLILVLVLLILVCSQANQGQATQNCPTISITGPMGIAAPGKVVTFTLSVNANEVQRQALQYRWTSGYGEIVSGQGTTSIQVRPPDRASTFRAEVEIAGLPAGCPRTYSETVTIDPVPIAIKIGEFAGAAFKGERIELNRIVSEINDNPGHQLYIYFAYEKAPGRQAALQREQKVLAYLSAAIAGRDRITAIRVFEGIELVEFWRVPPGANNPTCSECEKTLNFEDCPSVSMTGPAGITDPGGEMTFTSKLSGSVPPNVAYLWTLGDQGEITGGQGTLNLKVRAPNLSSYAIVATLEIKNLPAQCRNKFSETAAGSCRCDAILADEYDDTKLDQGKEAARLDSVINAFLRGPTDYKLYVVQYFLERAYQRKKARRMQLLQRFLTAIGKVPPERLEIVSSDGHTENRTKFYFVPPGIPNPTP